MSRQPLSAERTFRTVKTSDVYANLSHESTPMNGDKGHHTFGMVAMQLASHQTTEHGYRPREAEALYLAASTMPFIEAQYAMDTAFIKNDAILQQYRHQIEQFNHAVRDIIDNNPTMQFDELLNFIRRTYMQQPGADRNKLNACSSELRGVLVGMANEIGFEQIIEELGYNYRLASEEEDLNKGIDIYVETETGWIGIDVKSSLFGEQKNRAKQHNDERLVLWSHLEGSNFNESFRLSRDVVQQKARIIGPIIESYEPQLIAA